MESRPGIKGAISFLLGAVFLLFALSAGLSLASSRPDLSYEGFRAAMVGEVALKSAFYSSLSEAAQQAALTSSDGARGPPGMRATAPFDAHSAAVAAAHERALEFERQLKNLGYDAVFWCGGPSEQERILASREMMLEGKALAPRGTLPLPACADSFGADMLSGKLHLSNLGFSVYHRKAGVGRAANFPSSYEVDFR